MAKHLSEYTIPFSYKEIEGELTFVKRTYTGKDEKYFTSTDLKLDQVKILNIDILDLVKIQFNLNELENIEKIIKNELQVKKEILKELFIKIPKTIQIEAFNNILLMNRLQNTSDINLLLYHNEPILFCNSYEEKILFQYLIKYNYLYIQGQDQEEINDKLNNIKVVISKKINGFFPTENITLDTLKLNPDIKDDKKIKNLLSLLNNFDKESLTKSTILNLFELSNYLEFYSEKDIKAIISSDNKDNKINSLIYSRIKDLLNQIDFEHKEVIDIEEILIKLKDNINNILTYEDIQKEIDMKKVEIEY